MTGLPEAQRAVVDERKITRYLLSPEHPTGRFKAQFFVAFGFRLDAWEALRQHAQENDVAQTIATDFGTKYIVDGPPETPDGRRPRLRTVWFVGGGEAWFVGGGEALPRFVTAYPI